MIDAKIALGIFISLLGVLFFFNNKNMGKGAHELYKKLYTARNLTIIFRLLGILLFILGLILALS